MAPFIVQHSRKHRMTINIITDLRQHFFHGDNYQHLEHVGQRYRFCKHC